MRVAIRLTQSSVCIVLAFLSLAAAAQDRPRTDPVPAGTDAPELQAPAVETVSPRSPKPSAQRDLDDPRDGLTEPTESLELSPTEEEYFRAARRAVSEIGGDDVLVATAPAPLTYGPRDVQIASNGDIYVGASYYTSSPDFEEWVEVYRSTDGGTTFSLWGSVGAPGTPTIDQRLVSLCLAEGAEDRLFVQYMQLPSGSSSFDQLVAFADLSGSSATWTTRTLFATPGVSELRGEMISDDHTYASYYLYAVCSGIDGSGDDIWYTRSTDRGNTWSTPFQIAGITTSGNLMYSDPRIAYQFGGYLHVAWTYTERLQSTIDDGVRTRRLSNFGGSVADLDPSLWAMRSTTDGIDQRTLDIAASTTGDAVVLTIGQVGYGGYSDPHALVNLSAGGSTWGGYGTFELPWERYAEMEFRPSDSRFVAVGLASDGGADDVVLSSAAATSLGSWSAPQAFDDYATFTSRPSLALDPTHDNQAAVIFPGPDSLSPANWFDAEWRGDPGYPNYEPGFPVAIPAGPSSPPAIASFSTDAHDKIVFSDSAGWIHVISSDGSAAPGWPRQVPNLSTGAPVAVGAVDGSGEAFIVAGTSDGKVYAFDEAGEIRHGFPVTLGAAYTYVAIGAVGAPYEHWIVAASGNRVYWINWRGVSETTPWTFSSDIIAPPAIGDIDNDGIAEMVIVHGPVPGSGWYYVNSLEKGAGGGELSRSFPNSISGAPTLFDLDLDGDLEIAIPTNQGKVFVIHDDGSDVAGFPFDNGTGTPVTAVAAAQLLGTFEPDLAFCSRDFRAHLVSWNGVQQSSYPQSTGAGWWIYGAPIIDQVNRASSNIIVGSRDSAGWSFQNTGGVPPGWPKGLDDQIELSPASGDIDKDGRNEIVFLGSDMLHVLDVNYPTEPLASNRWPMYGYNAQRTGCLNCIENEDATAAPGAVFTRVSFAPPNPNPSNGSLFFRYDLPARATVSLEVFDVRGRRVNTIVKREEATGAYTVGFDGRDRHGVALASGQYFARLVVRGPGVDETVTRRFVLVR